MSKLKKLEVEEIFKSSGLASSFASRHPETLRWLAQSYFFMSRLQGEVKGGAGVYEGGGQGRGTVSKGSNSWLCKKRLHWPPKTTYPLLSSTKSSLRKLKGASTQVLLNSLQTEKGNSQILEATLLCSSIWLLPCLFLKGRLGHPYRKKKSPLSKLNLPPVSKRQGWDPWGERLRLCVLTCLALSRHQREERIPQQRGRGLLAKGKVGRGCVERKARIQSPGVQVGRLCDFPKCSKMGYMSDSTNSIISEGILEVSRARLVICLQDTTQHPDKLLMKGSHVELCSTT